MAAPSIWTTAFVVVLVVGGPRIGVEAVTVKSRRASAASGLAHDGGSSASLLLDLLQGLQKETQQGLKTTRASATWCKSTLAHRHTMIETLGRQLTEVDAAQQRLVADEHRLGGERGLVNSTVEEQGRRLHEASALVEFADREFSVEHGHLMDTLQAAGMAIRLLRQQQQAGQENADNSAGSSPSADDGSSSSVTGDLYQSLMQLKSSDHVEEGDRAAMSSYLGGGRDDPDKAADLLNLLVKLQAHLESDKADADKEHEAMTGKLHKFADKLDSSMMEAQTQAATIKTEAAQRKRESVRLDRKKFDLSALATAAKASGEAVKAACLAQRQERKQEAEQLVAGTSAVKDILKKLPRGSWLVDGSSQAPSFLQVTEPSAWARNTLDRAVQELSGLAQKFPDESTWYTEASKRLSDEGSDQLSVMNEPPKTEAGSAVLSPATTAAPAGDASDPLANIEQFVNNAGGSDDAADGSATTKLSGPEHAEMRAIESTYGSLMEEVQGKLRTAEDKRSWCKGILKSAASDRAALKRSLSQVDAKRHLQESAIADCEQGTKYSLAQHQIIGQQLEEMGLNFEEADHQREHFLATLHERSTQLVQAGSGLDQDSTKLFAGLLSIMAKQKTSLQHEKTVEPKLRIAVEDTDKTLLRLLADDARSNKFRLLQLRSEANLLDSLYRTRARALGGGATGKAAGEDMDEASAAAAAFCSEEGFPDQQQVERLNDEEREISAAEKAVEA
jgi:hypothetical protein